MEYSLVLLAFLMVFKMSACIKCYKCTADMTYNGDDICGHFNKSEKFLTDCLNSTMCHKRETTLHIENGSYVSVYRGCAPQTLDGDQVKIKGKWQSVNTIYEPYDEGCQEDRSDPDRPTRTFNCYCRGDLCNSSNTHALNPTLIYLIMLYLVS